VTLITAWLLYPLLVVVLSLGVGTVVERVAGVRVPGALVLPLGFAGVVVVASLATATARTAGLAAPAAVALAAAGLVLRGFRGMRPRMTPAAAAVAVFAVYAAPVALSGTATFAGYIKLDDTATFLAMLDRTMAHGRDIAGLPVSTYQQALAYTLARGYPTGSFVTVGVGSLLVRQDAAWLYQPTLALLGALLALALYALLRPLAGSRAFRAGAAFVAAQPALLYGYALWGGIKELTAAALIALACALWLPESAAAVRDWRRFLPLAVACAALLDALSVGGAVWLVPLAVAFGVAVGRRRLRAAPAALGVLALLVLAAPAVAAAARFLRPGNVDSFTSQSDMGNLARPLDPLQVLGIWPVGDFRTTPPDLRANVVLVAAVVLAGIVGVAAAIRERAWTIVVYAATGVFPVVVFATLGSVWVAAKGYATASPVLLACAAAGVAVAVRWRRVTEAVVVGGAIVLGVAWSNALAYRHVWLAPRARLAELAAIGRRFDGKGPLLMTEYEPYGVRHFLRNDAPEGASELRWRAVPLLGGALLSKGESADVDAFELAALRPYRTIVLRRSPSTSRPPSTYRLVWQGRYWDVWERAVAPQTQVVEHVPLGSGWTPSATTSCSTVLALAARAEPGDGVVAAPRTPSVVADLGSAEMPSGWTLADAAGRTFVPTGGGTMTVSVIVPGAGLYDVALGGSWAAPLRVRVDGGRTTTAPAQLDWPGNLVPLVRVRLAAGSHTVAVRFGGARWRPGSAATFGTVGPLVVGPDAPAAVVAVAPSHARALCGKSLDWLELVRPAPG